MDIEKIPALLVQANTPAGRTMARTLAKASWDPFPFNGCAAMLSSLLHYAGVQIQVTLGAGALAHLLLVRRKWKRIAVDQCKAGDVGVCYDEGGVPGSDHVYLVLSVETRKPGDVVMMIVDNQSPDPHIRHSAGMGKTATEYFLRATTGAV